MNLQDFQDEQALLCPLFLHNVDPISLTYSPQQPTLLEYSTLKKRHIETQ